MLRPWFLGCAIIVCKRTEKALHIRIQVFKDTPEEETETELIPHPPPLIRSMKMKNTKTVLTAISAALMFSLTAGAFAQKTGLVNVDILPIAKDIAMAINVNASRIPAAVQVKAPVAVDVCKVPEDRLAQQEKRGS